MVKSLEHLSYGESLRTVTDHLGKDKTQGGVISAFKCLKEGCTEDGAGLFSVMSRGSTKKKQVQTETLEVLSEHDEALLCCVGD